MSLTLARVFPVTTRCFVNGNADRTKGTDYLGLLSARARNFVIAMSPRRPRFLPGFSASVADHPTATRTLLGTSGTRRRDALLTFVGPELVAVRWKQFRTYFGDVVPSRSGWSGAHLLPGTSSSATPMTATPKSSTSSWTIRGTMPLQCTKKANLTGG